MKAIILAAGYGKRMLPLTNIIPKPLVQINNKYLIEYAIERLKQAGITDIIINLYHLGDQIKMVLGDGSLWGVKISYSEEQELLDTGGGILNILNNNLLNQEPFIVISADVITDLDCSFLLPKLSKLAHLVLVPNPTFKPNGDFSLDNNNTLQLTKNSAENYTYANIGIFQPQFFAQPPRSKKFPLVELMYQAINNHQITAEVYTGFWRNIGTLQDIQEIQPTFLNHTINFL